jgi:hypothetical protein
MVASFISNHNSDLSPKDTPLAPVSCCHHEREQAAKLEIHSNCCREKTSSTTNNAPTSIPQSTPPGQCCCSMERIDSALPSTTPKLAPHEWTGELVSLALLGIVDISLEHHGLLSELQALERAGVDTRSAVLFERHVLRC